jgi:uncharacterized membrane protein YbaN (DUF454 family)
VLKWIFFSLGTISVMGGVATFWLPLPIGLPLLLIGVALLMKSSPSVRNKILQLASSHPRLARFLEKKRLEQSDSE